MEMKFGISSLNWCLTFNESELHLIDLVSEMGFDGIELAPWGDFRKIKPDLLRKRLDNAGIEVCGLSGTFNDSNDISSEDPSIRQQGIDFIKEYSDWAKEIGTSIIGGPCYSEIGRKRTLPPDVRKAEWDRSADSLKRIGEDLDKKGVKLALEPINRFEIDLINTAAQAYEMCEQVSNPAIGMMLDTFHMNIEDKDICAAIKSSKKHLLYLHTCANDRGIPGEDHIPWDEIKATLIEMDYKGYGTIESFSEGEVGPFVCIWRQLAENQDVLAREGLKFLRKVFG